MLRLAGVSASARPLVTSGMALAMPPVPVRRADAGAGALEPRLEREGGGAEGRRRAERDVLARAVELEAGVATAPVTVSETVTVFESAVPSFAL